MSSYAGVIIYGIPVNMLRKMTPPEDVGAPTAHEQSDEAPILAMKELQVEEAIAKIRLANCDREVKQLREELKELWVEWQVLCGENESRSMLPASHISCPISN